MNTICKKVEFAANIAILIVALLITGVLVHRYILPNLQSSAVSAPSHIPPGTKIPLPDVNWGGNRLTLLLVLQKGCHFCTESAPFYQRLVREMAAQDRARLVAVLPQETNEGRQYLNFLDVSIDEVRQAPIHSLGVRGTPPLILVDHEGAVIDSWVGKLPASQETEVLNRLQASITASR